MKIDKVSENPDVLNIRLEGEEIATFFRILMRAQVGDIGQDPRGTEKEDVMTGELMHVIESWEHEPSPM